MALATTHERAGAGSPSTAGTTSAGGLDGQRTHRLREQHEHGSPSTSAAWMLQVAGHPLAHN